MDILEMVKKFGTYRKLSPGQYAGPCPECGGAVRFRIDLDQNAGKCQSCAFSLTGTDDASSDQSFPTAKLQQLISDTYSLVISDCPKGAREWIEEYRPDVAQHLKDVGQDVGGAFALEDEVEVTRALMLWERYHRRAFQLFADRPQVIDAGEE